MKDNDNRKMVEFVTNCSPYAAGERAAFQRRDAQKLVDRKVAIFLDDAMKAKEAEADADDEQNVDNEPNSGSGDGDNTESRAGKKSKSSKKKAGGKRKRVKADD